MVPGSAEAYGRIDPKDMPITESQPLRARNPYGLSKASQEMIAQYYQETFGMNIFLTRSFHYTGPGQPTGFVCSDFAKQIAEIERGMKDPVISVGNLKAKRDFLDIRDVVRAYWVIVEEGRPGVVYNVCSGRSVAIEEVLDTLVGMSHARISVSVDPARLRPVDVPDFVGDNSRLVRETSWRQRIALADSLRDVLEFWRGEVA
jgi:GDP-4-dehydro-6-deoxy-D-mannose reductase